VLLRDLPGGKLIFEELAQRGFGGLASRSRRAGGRRHFIGSEVPVGKRRGIGHDRQNVDGAPAL
jgi:hypothetical protein